MYNNIFAVHFNSTGDLIPLKHVGMNYVKRNEYPVQVWVLALLKPRLRRVLKFPNKNLLIFLDFFMIQNF